MGRGLQVNFVIQLVATVITLQHTQNKQPAGLWQTCNGACLQAWLLFKTFKSALDCVLVVVITRCGLSHLICGILLHWLNSFAIASFEKQWSGVALTCFLRRLWACLFHAASDDTLNTFSVVWKLCCVACTCLCCSLECGQHVLSPQMEEVGAV